MTLIPCQCRRGDKTHTCPICHMRACKQCQDEHEPCWGMVPMIRKEQA